MPTLPPYVSDRGHGEIAYAVPLQINGVTAYGFVLKSDQTQLQKFVDEQLNSVSGGAVRYTACPFVVQVCVNAKHGTSMVENIGWLSDMEYMFWVPVWQKREGHLLPELKLWIPYLFIDIQSGMTTGREVWGFRKTLARIAVPDDPDKASLFSAVTTIFPVFSPETQGVEAMLVKTQRAGGDQPTVAHWPDFAHALRDIVRGLENAAFEILPLVERVFAGLLGAPLIHAINLKQYRDAADSTRACYQALVDSPFRLDDWKAGGMLPGDYTVEITTCASHTIVSDLGLGTIGPGTTTVVRPLFAFWWKMDFSTQPGTVIWQAA